MADKSELEVETPSFLGEKESLLSLFLFKNETIFYRKKK